MKKTKKAVSKRIRITSTGKVMKRPMGVDHFKTRKSAGILRGKRHGTSLAAVDVRTFTKYMPHN